jgi:hypothetical protein
LYPKSPDTLSQARSFRETGISRKFFGVSAPPESSE